MSTRHAWQRIGVHRYQCTRCELHKTNIETLGADGRVNYTVSFARDGVEIASGKTPPCPGQIPTSITWERSESGPWWDANTGHRILAMRRADGWAYLALGPDRSAGWSYRAWSSGAGPHWSGQEPREHYARGEHIPQPRESLGICDSPEAARDLCANHASGTKEDA